MTTLLSDKDTQSLKDRFRRELKQDVTIRLFTQRTFGLTIPGRECAYCEQTQKLLEEVTGLSNKLHLEIKDFYSEAEEARKTGVERIPAMVISKNGETNVRFYGIPLGYEFATIIEDLITVSRGVSPLSLDTRKKLKRIKEPVHIQVFVTPSCGYCPQMARIAHAMAMENKNITADVVEVQEFPTVARMYMVSGVPKTVINNRIQFVGAVPEAAFADKVMEALEQPGKEEPSSTLAVAEELGPVTKQTG